MGIIYITAGRYPSIIYSYISAIVYCTFSSDQKKISTRFFLGIISCISLLTSEAIAAFTLIKCNILDPGILSDSPEESSIYQTIMMSSMSVVMIILSVIISFFHSEKNYTRINGLVLLVPVQQLLIIFFLNMIVSQNITALNNPVILALYILSSVFGMCLNIILIRTSDMISRKMITQQKNDFFEYYSKINQELNTRTENNLYEIQKIKHDFNNHLNVIKALIETKDTSNAAEMINQLETKYSGTAETRFSSNHIMDIILRNTADYCTKINTEFTCECNLPAVIEHQLDICSLTSNILQNACDAVSETEGKKEICFSASAQNEMIFLKCTNTYKNKILQKNSRILTTKKDKANHGFGIEIIKHTAETYNGNVIIENNNNSFMILVQINLRDNCSGLS